MSCKTEEKTINDADYVCTQFPAILGMQFKMELVSILGKALPDIMQMAAKKDSSNEDKAAALSAAATKLFETAAPEKVVDLIVRMLTTGHTKRNGDRITKSRFDEVYAGDNMSEAYKAFGFVVMVNYKGFFKGQGKGSTLSNGANQ
jgi:hypothetical protein